MLGEGAGEGEGEGDDGGGAGEEQENPKSKKQIPSEAARMPFWSNCARRAVAIIAPPSPHSSRVGMPLLSSSPTHNRRDDSTAPVPPELSPSAVKATPSSDRASSE